MIFVNYRNKTKFCRGKSLILDVCKLVMHQCYYCEQLFESKEALYEHVEVHSDMERNKEIMNRKKQAEKKGISD